jgi:16S rRNA (uracil1498-N3)-methyltransferase
MEDSRPARRRFRVANLEAGAAGVVELGAAVVRHLRVLRAAPGDRVRLFDGEGREVEAELVELADHAARARILGAGAAARTESPLRCWLVQALPVRQARMDTIVRQITELGVSRIVPVIAERSQGGRLGVAALQRRTDRWRRIADAAAEQCGRARVPQIDAPCRYDDLDWEGLPRPLFIATPEPAEPAAAAADRTTIAATGAAGATGAAAVTLMVGPEGGWSDAELATAAGREALPIGLGPRILRADTASVVAVALLQHRLGDLS